MAMTTLLGRTARTRRAMVLVSAVAVLAVGVGPWPAQAHGTGNAYGNDVEFGQIVAEDADTIRKVTPRTIVIGVGQTVTFHVNGSHQVVVLSPGVALEDLGSEGVNLDGTGPQTPLPPEVFPNAVVAAGLAPRFGPGRWDANPPSCGAGGTEATNTDRPQVFDKQDCQTPAGVTTDFTTVAFNTPGRYAFMCNFPIHSWDEGIAVTGPANPDQPIVVTGFGMHGFITVQ
jgi:plastocyanin